VRSVAHVGSPRTRTMSTNILWPRHAAADTVMGQR
jgi:hypothetical protein